MWLLLSAAIIATCSGRPVLGGTNDIQEGKNGAATGNASSLPPPDPGIVRTQPSQPPDLGIVRTQPGQPMQKSGTNDTQDSKNESATPNANSSEILRSLDLRPTPRRRWPGHPLLRVKRRGSCFQTGPKSIPENCPCSEHYDDCVPGLVCNFEERSCECPDSAKTYFDSTQHKCVEKKEDGSKCKGIRECLSGKGLCIDIGPEYAQKDGCCGESYHLESGECEFRKSAGETCEKQEDCAQHLNCVGKGCCEGGKYFENLVCRDRKSSGELCAQTVECQGLLECINGGCCGVDQYFIPGQGCEDKKTHTQPCNGTQECSEGFECNGGLCCTKNTEVYDSSEKKCKKIPTCTEHTDCDALPDCGENTTCCQNGGCCSGDKFYKAGVCVDTTGIGRPCTINEECSGSLRCKKDKEGKTGLCDDSCQTTEYYDVKEGECVTKKPNGAICSTPKVCINGSCTGSCCGDGKVHYYLAGQGCNEKKGHGELCTKTLECGAASYCVGGCCGGCSIVTDINRAILGRGGDLKQLIAQLPGLGNVVKSVNINRLHMKLFSLKPRDRELTEEEITEATKDFAKSQPKGGGAGIDRIIGVVVGVFGTAVLAIVAVFGYQKFKSHKKNQQKPAAPINAEPNVIESAKPSDREINGELGGRGKTPETTESKRVEASGAQRKASASSAHSGAAKPRKPSVLSGQSEWSKSSAASKLSGVTDSSGTSRTSDDSGSSYSSGSSDSSGSSK